MSNIKIMFRSPRFLTGFVLMCIVIVYALLYPLINTADPKADREENPVYAYILPLRDALQAQDDAAAESSLMALESGGEEDLQAVAAAVRATLETGGLTKALSGAKQVKRTNPLYGEFETLRMTLGADDPSQASEEAALAELARLTEHHEAVVSIARAAQSGNFGPLAESALEEMEPLREAVASGDTASIDEAAETLLNNHEATYEWIVKIEDRLSGGGYEEALEALSGIQKTMLIAKDQPPSQRHPFGTDSLSRDILLEMAYGARVSLTVGLLAGAIATIIGLTIGLTAGFVGGAADNILNTLTNIFIVIPSMIVLILIAVALGQIRDAWVTGLVIGLTAWPWTARGVRAQTISLRNRDHVSMARITGYSTGRIILTEILPYIASYVVMAFILQVASGIMQEATLSILGLGDPTAISLGRMINWAMQYEAVRSGRWWQFIPVATCIAMITFGLYMMNSGMDQVFNPKIRS